MSSEIQIGGIVVPNEVFLVGTRSGQGLTPGVVTGVRSRGSEIGLGHQVDVQLCLPPRLGYAFSTQRMIAPGVFLNRSGEIYFVQIGVVSPADAWIAVREYRNRP